MWLVRKLLNRIKSASVWFNVQLLISSSNVEFSKINRIQGIQSSGNVLYNFHNKCPISGKLHLFRFLNAF